MAAPMTLHDPWAGLAEEVAPAAGDPWAGLAEEIQPSPSLSQSFDNPRAVPQEPSWDRFELQAEDSWWDVVSKRWPSRLASVAGSAVQGVQQFRADDANVPNQLFEARLAVMPEAVKALREQRIPLTMNPKVIEAAKLAGVTPEEFAFVSNIEDYENLDAAKKAKLYGEHHANIIKQARLQESTDEHRARTQEFSEASRVNADPWSAKALSTDLVGALPQLGLAAGAAILGGPAAGGAVMLGSVAPGQYAEARDMGYDMEDSMKRTVAMSAPELIGEIPVLNIMAKTPAGKALMKKVVGRYADRFLGKVTGTAISEGVGEQITEALQMGAQVGLFDESVSADEALDRLAKAGVLGAILGGGLGAASHATDPDEPEATQPEPPAASLADALNTPQAAATPDTMTEPATTGSPPPASAPSKVLAPEVGEAQGAASSPQAAPPYRAPAPAQQTAPPPAAPPPQAPQQAQQAPPQTEVPPAAPSPIATPGPAPQAVPVPIQTEGKVGGTTAVAPTNTQPKQPGAQQSNVQPKRLSSAQTAELITRWQQGRADIKTRKGPDGSTQLRIDGEHVATIPGAAAIDQDTASKALLEALSQAYQAEGRTFPTRFEDMTKAEFGIAYRAGAVPEVELSSDEIDRVMRTNTDGSMSMNTDALYDLMRERAGVASAPAQPALPSPTAAPAAIAWQPHDKKAKVPPRRVAVTGKPLVTTVYRGSGKSAKEIYSGAQVPVAGQGGYYAFNPTDAANYGGNIQQGQVTLSNPLVITNDDEWRALTRGRAGWEFPNPYGKDEKTVKAWAARLREVVTGDGHDSLVIQMDNDGDAAKTLRNVFDHDQIVDYNERAPAPASQTPVSKRETAQAQLPTKQQQADSQGVGQQAATTEQNQLSDRVPKQDTAISRQAEAAPEYTVEEGDANAQAEFDRLQAEAERKRGEVGEGNARQTAERTTPTGLRPVAAPESQGKDDDGPSKGRQDNVRGREAARTQREVSDDRQGVRSTISGEAPRADWETKTKVAVNGKPLQVHRGSEQALVAEHFLPDSLGKNSDHPSSGLGVFFTTSPTQARGYGSLVQPAYLDIRNPWVVRNEVFPGFDSLEQANALQRDLQRKGYDGIHIVNKHIGPGAYDWFVAFEPHQVIHETEAGAKTETSDEFQQEPDEYDLSGEFTEDELSDAGKLADSAQSRAPAKTGPAQTGQPVSPRAGTESSDPIRQIAARKVQEAEASIESRDTTPAVAPKRKTKLGRSTFDSMWRDYLGIPEDGPQTPAEEQELLRIQNSPMSEQIKIATKMVKERFDFREIELDPELNEREQMDVLLDAYNNLHTMANVMSQPRQAMGFNGQLGLKVSKSIEKNKGMRGQFAWSFKDFAKSTIDLARRADSFTHEWFHALDVNLLMRFYKARVDGVSELSLYSTQPLNALPPKVGKAFIEVMRALFVKDEAAAHRLADLSAKAVLKKMEIDKARSRTRVTDSGKKAERVSSVAQLERELAELNDEMGKVLSTQGSQFHEAARYLDALAGRKYLSLPTEMLARAGEAWMGNRIGQQSGTEVLSGSPEFYNENVDRVMQLSYPNAAEREGIFQKFDALFTAISEEQYFEGETVAARLPGDTVVDKELADAARANEQASVTKRAYEAVRGDFVNVAMAVGRVLKGGWTGDAADAAKSTANNIKQSSFVTAFWSAAGRMDGLIRAYKGNPRAQALIRKFARKLALNPGAREETEGATVQDRIDRKKNIYDKRLDSIVKAHKLDPSDADQMAALFEETARPTDQVRQELMDHNEFLEEELERSDLTDVDRQHIQSNLAANNEVLSMTPPPEVPTTNIQKAALAIRKLQDELFYDAQQAKMDIGYVSNYMRRALNHEAIANDREGFLQKAELAYRATNARNARQLARAISQSKNKQEVAKLKEELAEIRALNPKTQAEEFLWALTVPDVYKPQGLTTPSTKFTKPRTLGPAADLLLADYYDQNPVRSLYNSISASVYRTTFAEMFGPKGEQLDLMRKEMIAAGVKETDLAILDDALRIAFGQTGNFVSPTDALVNWAMLLAQIKLLGRSAFTNFMEPALSGLRTGNVLDSIRALANSYLPMLNRAEAAEQQFVMETLGLVASTAHETVFANRTGISGENALLRKVYTGFGKLSKIQWLTERGRYGSYRVLANYLRFMSLQAADAKTGVQQREAQDELNELGIPREKHAEFIEFMRSLPKGRMTEEALLKSGNQEMKDLYGNAMHVLLRQSIQSPQRVERARGSFHPVGRFVFSITNFTRSFERNVIARNYKQIMKAEGFDRKALAAARFGSTAGALVLFTVLSNMARDWWDDPERAEKKRKEGYYTSGKGFLDAIDRAGFTGRFSPLYNTYAKSKFDREVSALTAGAVPSFYIDSFSKMYTAFRPWGKPTPKEERAGWSALYDLGVGMGAPLLAIGAGATGPIGWMATTKAQSRGARDAFAEAMVPKTPGEQEAEAQREARANETPAQKRLREMRAERAKTTRERNLRYKYGDSP